MEEDEEDSDLGLDLGFLVDTEAFPGDDPGRCFHYFTEGNFFYGSEDHSSGGREVGSVVRLCAGLSDHSYGGHGTPQ